MNRKEKNNEIEKATLGQKEREEMREISGATKKQVKRRKRGRNRKKTIKRNTNIKKEKDKLREIQME